MPTACACTSRRRPEAGAPCSCRPLSRPTAPSPDTPSSSCRPASAVAYQSDTLVVAAHRGHALGMRMKLANLVRLGEVAPERTTVYTWNADENEHMLAINIALGFEPHGMSAEFQRG